MPQLISSSCLFLLVVILFLNNNNLFNSVFSQSIIKTLPGYNGTLPFKLETGYIGVDEEEEVQLFYYFVESERDPIKDPLVLWHPGGAGCSAFSSFVFEHIGPLSFNLEGFDGSLPSLLLNSYSWTKVASIIFLDSPVGTGFSYSTTSKGEYASTTKTVLNTYEFLQKNRLYISGDSFGGKLAPLIVTHITKENEAFAKPRMNLKGYIIGNPVMEGRNDNERIPYAFRVGLISKQYFKSAKKSCKGEYFNSDPNNVECLNAMQLINMCLEKLYSRQFLEPICASTTQGEDSSNIVLPSQTQESWCRDNNYVVGEVWANDPTVQEALHVRKGTKAEWNRCNTTLVFDESDVLSALPYHQYLTNKNLEALIYNGDHDMLIPYSSTLKWISSLNLTLDDNWRPWLVNGQVAGYTKKYLEGYEFSLTYATVKGAGHTAPEYKPKECFAMVERWLSGYAL